MNRFGILFKPLMWLMALMLTAFVAGCGGGNDAAPATPSAAGAVCAGVNCVPLLTAGSFVILTAAAITDAATTSPILGNVGTRGLGTAIDVSCAEVTGTIYDIDGNYAGGVGGTDTTCRLTNDALLAQAVADSQAAYLNAQFRGPPTEPVDTLGLAGGDIGGLTIAPGIHQWTGNVAISSSITLTGTPADVWIFQIGGNLTEAAAAVVILGGTAKAENIFWQVAGTTALTAGAQFEGIILSPVDISLGAGASANSRLFSGTAVNLITNTVRRPGE